MVKAIKLTPGELLYDSVTTTWDLHPGAVEMLLMACEVRDQIEETNRIVKAEGILTTGSRGQPIAHPAVQLGKQLRVTFANLMAKLELEYPEDKKW